MGSVLLDLNLQLDNYADLANVLNCFYPETDLLNITEQDIIKMLKEMGFDFQITNQQDIDFVNAIINVWIELQYDETESSIYDAWS